MKKITFLMAALMIGTAVSTVKAQFDVGCTAIPNVPPNADVYPNVSYPIQYTRENFGNAVTTADVDSFTMEILVDGIRRQTFYRNMGTPFGISANETTQGVADLEWATLGVSAGTHSLCVQTRLWKNGVNIDAVPSNDATCLTVNYSGDSNPFTFDLEIMNVQVTNPVYSPGSNIPHKEFLVEATFDIKNAGTNQIPAGVTFDIIGKSGGTSATPITYQLNQGMSPSGIITAVTYDCFSNGLKVPSQDGAFDICFAIDSPDDINGSNDESCSSYFTAVADVAPKVDPALFYNNGNLVINMNDGATGKYTLEIISMNGQKMLNESFNADTKREFSFSVSELNNGMYIANMTSVETGEKMSVKFIR